MKNLKKVVLTGILTVASAFTINSVSNAATVKVTGETLNIRKGPSTETSVIAQISEGVECELLEKDGDWYKVKYKSYTGYVNKQYVKVIGEENSQNNSQTNSQTSTEKPAENAQEGNEQNNSEPSTNEQANQTKPEETNNEQTSANNNETTNKITYKKLKQKTDIKILPLIHSSNIGTIAKNEEVVFITELSGWTYIQTNTISGWVRSNILENSKSSTINNDGTDRNSTSSNNETDETESKVGYINEDTVNLRKGAGTNYDIIKVLRKNAEVTILKEEKDWYQVKSGSDTGYVSKEFVSTSKKVTTRSSTAERKSTNKVVGLEDDVDNLNETNTSNTNSENTNSLTVILNENDETSNENSSKKNESTSKENSSDEKDSTSKESSSEEKNSSSKENTSNDSDKQKESTSKEKESSSKSESSNIKSTDIVAYARKYLGHKYVYGGDGSDGTFDCSGFTMYVYKHFGISLPHGATSQYNSGKGKKITKESKLQVGDIVFLTDYETGEGIGHCGIYLGNGNFIHASTTTYTVTISSLETMYAGRFYAGLRLI